MGLTLHNPRPRPETFTYLAVPWVDDAMNAVISIGKASVYSGVAFGAFNTFALPATIITAATISTAYTTLCSTYENRTQQSLKTGRVKVRSRKMPEW